MAKVAAYRVTNEDGKPFDLVYDTDDVESFETPIDVRDITKPEDKAVRREPGKAHLILHFREGKRPMWEPIEKGGDH